MINDLITIHSNGINLNGVIKTDRYAFWNIMNRAPEILTRSGHGKAVDWWSLGALMYDMLTGLVCTMC